VRSERTPTTAADRLALALRRAARKLGDPRLARWVERLISGDQAARPAPEPSRRRQGVAR
jgi:hypothetical protein